MNLIVFLLISACVALSVKANPTSPTYGYVCKSKFCVKERNTAAKPSLNNLEKCKLNCADYGSIWPKPTGEVQIGAGWRNFNLRNIEITQDPDNPETIRDLLDGAVGVFHGYLEIEDKTKNLRHGWGKYFGQRHRNMHSNNVPIRVTLTVTDPEADPIFKLKSDESYELIVRSTKTNIKVSITGSTFYGVRHGLETLSQLIAWDDANDDFTIVNSASIKDAPVYAYRGLMIDTSRNFISIPRIKRHIDGLSFNKLNIMHWHITDSQSFPMHVIGRDEFVKYGAYSPEETYTVDEMKEIVDYARIRGVKVVVEFDAPAHVGNGWVWDDSLPEEKQLAVCVGKEPWQRFCIEPPCGQLNLANPEMYEVLGDIYKTLMSVFDNDVFHMGGDEVDIRCYNSTKVITDYMAEKGWARNMGGYAELWGEFESKAYDLWDSINPGSDKLAILWTSELASPKYVTKFLPKEKFAIQMWLSKRDPGIPYLIKNNYQVIFSNFDALYLDCGYHNWIGNSGNNWCSPYNTWQSIYENSPYEIYMAASNRLSADKAMADGLILGAIAPLWSEQVDEQAMESRFWPRGSALAERLWSDPRTTGPAEAVNRMNRQRERIVKRGIEADRLQPEYCYQNENKCTSKPVKV